MSVRGGIRTLSHYGVMDMPSLVGLLIDKRGLRGMSLFPENEDGAYQALGLLMRIKPEIDEFERALREKLASGLPSKGDSDQRPPRPARLRLRERDPGGRGDSNAEAVRTGQGEVFPR